MFLLKLIAYRNLLQTSLRPVVSGWRQLLPVVLLVWIAVFQPRIIAQDTTTANANPQPQTQQPVVQPTENSTPAATPQQPPAQETEASPVSTKTDTATAGTTAEKSPEKTTAEKTDSTKSKEPANIVEAIKQTQPQPQFSLTFGKIFWSVVFIIVALYLIRWLTGILEAVAERYPNLRLTIKRLIPAVRIATWTFVLFEIVVVILEPPIETIIAFTASAGIAIGFASQDILKNIFGGLMILFDRPFQVGDKVEAAGHYGEVVQIGLRTVRIVTPDDNLVSVPNGEIMNQAVSNANAGESNCQVVAEFYLPPDIHIEKTRDIAYLAAATSRYVFLNKPIAVIFKNEMHEGRSLLKMRLKAYVLDIRYEFPFMSEMTETVISELLAKDMVKREDLMLIQSDKRHT